MKLRTKKKYKDALCKHMYIETDQYEGEFYDVEACNLFKVNHCSPEMCYNCPYFSVTRKGMKEYHKWKKECKKTWQRYRQWSQKAVCVKEDNDDLPF